MEPLLSLIIFLIIAAIVLWLVQTITANLPGLSPVVRSLILAVTALILLLAFLRRVGIV